MSVVVPSLNGATTIGACLDGLVAQQFDQPYEIVVVDDGSRDATPAIARSRGVTVVAHQRTMGAAAARTTGATTARSPVLAFVDDDCVPDTGWLGSLMAAWEGTDANVVAIAGVTRPKDVDSLARRFAAASNPLVPLEAELGEQRNLIDRLRGYLAQTGSPPRVEIRPGLSAVGANMSVRSAAFWDVGGFDADTPGGGEEEDLCRRLRGRYGPGTVMIHPEVIVAHDFARSVWANLARSRSYGFGAGVRWTREGGLPTLRPAPLALVVLVGPLAKVSPKAAGLVTLALPYCIFSDLTRRAIRCRDAEAAIYPLLAFAHEVGYDVGCIEGIFSRWRRAVACHGLHGGAAPGRSSDTGAPGPVAPRRRPVVARRPLVLR